MSNRLAARDGQILAGLAGLLFSIFLFTFSGRYISDDELFLMDTTESIARRASIFMTETGSLRWPGETQVEPIQPLLAAPLFWLANRLPFVGNVHAVMLFNPLVTTATAGLVYLFLLVLEYPRRVGVAAALTFGLTTIAWPYSKNFFREPLTGLLLFGTACLLLRWRRAVEAHESRALGWLAGAAMVGGFGLLTKEAALIALPVLVAGCFPWGMLLRRRPREIVRAVGVIAGVIAFVAVGVWFYVGVLRAGVGRWAWLTWDPWGLADGGLTPGAWQAFAGFIASPGKSLFLYSPICALALISFMPQPAAGHRRFDALWPLWLLAVFVPAYAVARGELWHGGTGWGPRYMVPLTPFLVVASAPIFHSALMPRGSFAARLAVVLLSVAGLAVQIGGVVVFPLDYYRVLGEAGGVAWIEGMWDITRSAIWTHWQLLGAGLPDFAWAVARASGPDWKAAALLGGSAIGFAAWLICSGRFDRSYRPVRSMMMVSLGSLAGLVFLTGVFLWRIYPDRRYRGDNAALQAMMDYWQKADLPDKALILNNGTYFDFVLNYAKGDALIFSLPYSPTDQLPAGGSPPPPSTDPNDVIYIHAHSVVDYFPGFHQTAGLLMETGPYHPGVVRAVEWWMAETYYHVETREFAPDVRLVVFSTARAPRPADTPAYRVGALLDGRIALAGYDVKPPPEAIWPGQLLNISVQWLPVGLSGDNYTVSFAVVGPDGNLALQHDSWPVAGFWPALDFVPGTPVRDNVAFYLPPDLLPGTYEVWVLMYNRQVLRLPVTDAAGRAIGDHVTLFEIEIG